MDRLVTLEEMVEWSSGYRVVHCPNGIGVVDADLTVRERGLLKRWVPVRPLPETGFRGFLRSVQLAWGVLIGRYDAFSWDLVDDPEGQLYQRARARAKQPGRHEDVKVRVQIKD